MTKLLKQPLPLAIKVILVLLILCGCAAMYFVANVEKPTQLHLALFIFSFVGTPLCFAYLWSEMKPNNAAPQKSKA